MFSKSHTSNNTQLLYSLSQTCCTYNNAKYFEDNILLFYCYLRVAQQGGRVQNYKVSYIHTVYATYISSIKKTNDKMLVRQYCVFLYTVQYTQKLVNLKTCALQSSGAGITHDQYINMASIPNSRRVNRPNPFTVSAPPSPIACNATRYSNF